MKTLFIPASLMLQWTPLLLVV